jgi:hypothetical protein
MIYRFSDRGKSLAVDARKELCEDVGFNSTLHIVSPHPAAGRTAGVDSVYRKFESATQLRNS